MTEAEVGMVLLLALKMKELASKTLRSQGMWAALEAEKCKETAFPLVPPKGRLPCPPLDFSPLSSIFGHLTYRTVR